MKNYSPFLDFAPTVVLKPEAVAERMKSNPFDLFDDANHFPEVREKIVGHLKSGFGGPYRSLLQYEWAESRILGLFHDGDTLWRPLLEWYCSGYGSKDVGSVRPIEFAISMARDQPYLITEITKVVCPNAKYNNCYWNSPSMKVFLDDCWASLIRDVEAGHESKTTIATFQAIRRVARLLIEVKDTTWLPKLAEIRDMLKNIHPRWIPPTGKDEFEVPIVGGVITHTIRILEEEAADWMKDPLAEGIRERIYAKPEPNVIVNVEYPEKWQAGSPMLLFVQVIFKNVAPSRPDLPKIIMEDFTAAIRTDGFEKVSAGGPWEKLRGYNFRFLGQGFYQAFGEKTPEVFESAFTLGPTGGINRFHLCLVYEDSRHAVWDVGKTAGYVLCE